MKTNSAGLALVILGMAGQGMLSGCKPASGEPDNAAAPPVPVQVVQPKLGAITRSITLPGQIKSLSASHPYAKVAGYLKSITVDKGDPIQEGGLIADIEDDGLHSESDSVPVSVYVSGRVSHTSRGSPIRPRARVNEGRTART